MYVGGGYGEVSLIVTLLDAPPAVMVNVSTPSVVKSFLIFNVSIALLVSITKLPDIGMPLMSVLVMPVPDIIYGTIVLFGMPVVVNVNVTCPPSLTVGVLLLIEYVGKDNAGIVNVEFNKLYVAVRPGAPISITDEYSCGAIVLPAKNLKVDVLYSAGGVENVTIRVDGVNRAVAVLLLTTKVPDLMLVEPV